MVKHIESVKFPLPGYPHFPITAPYELEKKTIESKDRGISEKKIHQSKAPWRIKTRGLKKRAATIGRFRGPRHWRLDCTSRGASPSFRNFSDVELKLDLATLLLLLDLQEQCTVDAGQDTTEGDGCADESVQFFITTDGKLEVARRDTLDLEILGGITRQFENFGSQVLKNSGHVDGS